MVKLAIKIHLVNVLTFLLSNDGPSIFSIGRALPLTPPDTWTQGKIKHW